MLLTKAFFGLQKEHTVDKKVTAIARLTFYENMHVDWARSNCPLSALTDVHIKRVQFRGNGVKAFPRDIENSRSNEEPSSQANSTVLGAIYLCLDQSMTNIVEKRSSSRHQDYTNNPTELGRTEIEMFHPNCLLYIFFR